MAETSVIQDLLTVSVSVLRSKVIQCILEFQQNNASHLSHIAIYLVAACRVGI